SRAFRTNPHKSRLRNHLSVAIGTEMRIPRSSAFRAPFIGALQSGRLFAISQQTTGRINMPIYEFACPKCRVIFNFLSKRINPDRAPVCPKCGNKRMEKQLSPFAMPRGAKEPSAADGPEGEGADMPDMDDPRVMRAMSELERDMEHMDENN